MPRHLEISTRWLWTGESLQENPQLSIEDGRIAASASSESLLDFPGAVAIPGLVNGHVHLDLTFEPEHDRIDRPFPDWLLGIRDLRESEGEAGLTRAADRGIAESLAHGTTTLVDYDAVGASPDAIAEAPIRAAILREIIAFRPDSRYRERYERRSLRTSSERTLRGLAPHAPYTVHPDILRALLDDIAESGCPWSTHLAEQPFEDEFLEQGQGPYADFLTRVGLDPTEFPHPSRPSLAHLLDREPLPMGGLIVHANYLRPGDVDRLLATGSTVVFCPRSHRFFGHHDHPFRELMAAGVPVILGTDGKVSNGSLSLLDELAEVHRLAPDLAPDALLSMVTTHSHRALDHRLGTGRLRPGDPADLAVFQLDDPDADPLLQLVTGRARCLLTVVAGEIAHAAS